MNSKPTEGLSTLDGISLVFGIVVGVSIFKVPPAVFSFVETPLAAMGIWIVAGVLAFVGALSYAELATAYPKTGGDYVYLTEAFGRRVGFLFGWAQLTAILTGSIGAMAFVFADYATQVWEIAPSNKVALALGSIAVITAINLIGLKFGKTVQNGLSLLKLASVFAIAAAGFVFGSTRPRSSPEVPAEYPNLGLAFIFVMYAYGGWNDAAFVAAEVRDPVRNVPRVLLGGVALITSVYIIFNLACLYGLGFEGVRASSAPAADLLLRSPLKEKGAIGMSLAVMISALGAINGLVLAGPRVYAALGADHRFFRALAKWHPGRNVPMVAMLAQGLVALGLVFLVGTAAGRGAIDSALTTVGLSAAPWADYNGGFETLVATTSPVFWAFFLLTGVSLFVLRAKDPDRPRPFRVPLYPLTTLIFCAASAFMLWKSIDYAKNLTWFGLALLLPGPASLPSAPSSRKLGEQFVPHVTEDIGQAEVTALVAVGLPLVIDA